MEHNEENRNSSWNERKLQELKSLAYKVLERNNTRNAQGTYTQKSVPMNTKKPPFCSKAKNTHKTIDNIIKNENISPKTVPDLNNNLSSYKEVNQAQLKHIHTQAGYMNEKEFLNALKNTKLIPCMKHNYHWIYKERCRAKCDYIPKGCIRFVAPKAFL